jgi:hypothetical protein
VGDDRDVSPPVFIGARPPGKASAAARDDAAR